MAKQKKMKNDRALRFYNQVLDLERLHYGMWLPEDEVNFDNLRAAQQRYEDHLIKHIPEGTKKILDVGCGTGVMSRNLKALGFDVEGLSPDITQKDIFAEKVHAPFHFVRFEDFTGENKYDLIIMSESSQYIPLKSVFKVASEHLKNNGHLMMCDFMPFRKATGVFRKSGHIYEDLLEEAKSNEFKTLIDEDITEKTTKTLIITRNLLDKVMLSLDLATEKVRIRYPRLTKFILWLFRKKIAFHKENARLLDPEQFAANKTYRFMLFQKTV